MRGIIFTAYTSFIEERFGYEVLDTILLSEEFPNKGGFSSGGNYQVKYLCSLLHQGAHLFENSIEKITYAFGLYSFKFLMDHIEHIYQKHNPLLHINNAYDFLDNLNELHFRELQKIYPQAHFPRFDIERISKTHITLIYSSKTNLPELVHGLIDGCLLYYHETSSVQMKLFEGKEFPEYIFEVKQL